MTEDEAKIALFACRSVGETFTEDDWEGRQILLSQHEADKRERERKDAEIERLRRALEKIAKPSADWPSDLRYAARQALTPKESRDG